MFCWDVILVLDAKCTFFFGQPQASLFSPGHTLLVLHWVLPVVTRRNGVATISAGLAAIVSVEEARVGHIAEGLFSQPCTTCTLLQYTFKHNSGVKMCKLNATLQRD